MEDQDFKIHFRQIFLHQTEKERKKWENGHLKPLFLWVADKAHPGAMASTRRQHCVQKEYQSFLEKKKERGTFPIRRQRGILVYKTQLDPFNKWHWVFLAVRRGVMNDPLKLSDET